MLPISVVVEVNGLDSDVRVNGVFVKQDSTTSIMGTVCECSGAGFQHSHSLGVRVILWHCIPTGLRFLKFLVGALEEVVLGVQYLLGEGRAVQVVLRAVVDWKRGDVEETSKGMTWLT